MAKEIPLNSVASVILEKLQLFRSFHALRRDRHSQFMTNLNGFSNHYPVSVVRVHIRNERLVDLELAGWDDGQVLHHRKARTKIVD